MSNYDIVIVGNGVLGCSTALELIRADAGLRVAVVGPARRPGAATTAAGAMLGCFAELNHRSLSSTAGRAKLTLSIEALEAWPMWLEELNAELPAEDSLSVRQGTHVILNSRGGRLDSLNYQAILDALGEYGGKHEEMSHGEVPGLQPSVDARPLAALYLPDEGAIDARRVLARLVAAARARNVSFLDASVVGWNRDGNRVTSAITDSAGLLSADRFMVAAGAHSRALVADLADDAMPMQPMVSGKGVAVTVGATSSAIENVVRTPNRAGGCGLHYIPGRDQMVYLGATNDLLLRPDSAATLGMAHFLVGCAIEQIDNRLFQSPIVRWHVGNRPGSIDGFPLIGKLWQDNLWFLSGTYRDGFHCSPVLARQMADQLTDGSGLLGEHPFHPLRRPLHGMDRRDATEEIILHSVSQFYEYAARPPLYMRVADSIERQVRAATDATYDLLETDLGLAPEVLELLNWGPRREANIGSLRDYFRHIG